MLEAAVPLSVRERIELLDILRGLAIFGVLVMSLIRDARYEPPGAGEAVDFVIANKALSLLSMLFGIGFGVLMFRAESKDRRFLATYLRRMAALFAIGIIHWILVWNSILLSYAVIGCTLLLFRRLPVWALIASACLLLVPLQFQRAIMQPIPGALGYDAAQLKAAQNARASLTKRLEDVQQRGSYSELVVLRAQGLRNNYDGVLAWIRAIFPAYYLPMAVLGLAVVKSGLLYELQQRHRLLKTVMWFALVVGLASNPLPYLPLGKLSVPGWGYRLSFLLSGPSLALFYACAIALAVQTKGGCRLLGWLRWPGRTALTTYVVQTILIAIVCYGFGFGLMKKINVPQALGIAIVIFPVLAALSAAWLRHFEFGPLEWLWRTLTYGRIRFLASSVSPAG